MTDLAFCAHYPFTDEAREWVRGAGVQINSQAIDVGEARLVAAMRDGAIPKRASEMTDELSAEIVSYAAARLILSFLKNRYVASRLAVAEAKRARSYLESAADRKAGYVERIAPDLGLHFIKQGEEFTLPFWEYLAYTPRAPDYKLSNRELSGGLVRVTNDKRLRIMEEAVRKRIEGSLPHALKEYPEEVKQAAVRVLKYMPREEIAPTSISRADFPPCIRKMLEDLRVSVNVPHSGRYALAIYLIKAGLGDEQISALFRTAPDFNHETTGYQVRYIRQKNYTPPACATMDTWGFCIADCRCGSPARYRQALHARNVPAEVWADIDGGKAVQEDDKAAQAEKKEGA